MNTRGAGGQGRLEVAVVSTSHGDPLVHSGHTHAGLGGPESCVVCRQLSPSQRKVPCHVESQPGAADARLIRYTPAEEGQHAVTVTYDGHPVPGSPFPVEAQMPPDPSKVPPPPSDV